jgi:hypothetical protein
MGSSSQQMFIVTVKGIQGTFMSKSGGDTTSNTTKVYNGGSKTPELLAAPAETDNITISRAYNHDRDYQVLKNCRAKVGRWRTNISVAATDEDLNTRGKSTQYVNALLVRMSEPEYDSAGNDASSFELEFAVASIK